MRNLWVIKPKPKDEIVSLLEDEVRLPKALATILAQRGIVNFDLAKEFFRPDLSKLYDPFLMVDMQLAVDRVLEAIRKEEKILIYGDYDVDGTTAVAMMYDFLKSIYPNVTYYIPDRYTEGYGISIQGIDYANDNDISLIIALDCGIKAVEKVEYASEKNIDIIICDHHLPGEKLPKAVAVLDPKRPDCQYPFKELTGCGVGFKLIQALAKELKIDEENLHQYLDLLVVSIAADIVPIVDENRIVSYYGLKKLKESPSLGLAALLGEQGRDNLTISYIVFQIAPKINASGRLEHASQSVELLISKDEKEVKKFANDIDIINHTRKKTDGNVTEEAIQLIIDQKEEDNYSTVIYDANWHKGVLGIVASRLIDTFYRPTLVLTDGNEGEITGSARSIKDFDIYEVIDQCSDLLLRYGGHQFAAGLTMKKENLAAFKERFENLVKEKIRPSQRKPSIEIDTELMFTEIDARFLRILKQLMPFGPENPTPLFLTKNLKAGNIRTMGKENEHLRMALMDENGVQFNAIGFGLGETLEDIKYSKSIDVIYSIDENHWNNKVYLQLNIRDLRLNSF